MIPDSKTRGFLHDPEFQVLIGGYPQHLIVRTSEGLKQSLMDDNLTDPDVDTEKWRRLNVG